MARVFNHDWERLAPLAHYDAGVLARLCLMTARQMQRQFHRQFARSPQDWLNEQRLKAAPRMLLAGQQIKVVATELGYKQTSHFCREFKSYHHLTPSQFVNAAQSRLTTPSEAVEP